MIFFLQFRPWGTIKYAWGLITEGVHGDPCQLPDYKVLQIYAAELLQDERPCSRPRPTNRIKALKDNMMLTTVSCHKYE